jgi:hypothetical protein
MKRHLALLPLAVVLSATCSSNKVPGTLDASPETTDSAADGQATDRASITADIAIADSVADRSAADRVTLIGDTASTDSPAGAGDTTFALQPNATEVCVAAIKTSVDRSNRCYGDDMDYRPLAAACPDYYYVSPGVCPP